MEKIVNRRSINYKFFFLFLILLFGLGYFLFEQFYSFKKREALKKIDFLISNNQDERASEEIEKYVVEYESSEDIIKKKIVLLSKEIPSHPEKSNELIRLIFFSKSVYSEDDDNLNLVLGKTYFSKGEDYYEQSKFYLEKYLKNKPYNQDIYLILYRVNFKLGFYEAATFYLDELLKKNPSNLELKVNYIELLLLTSEELEAQRLLENFIINEDYNKYTGLVAELLLKTLYEFNLEKKITFYDNLIHIKYKEHKIFIDRFDEFHSKLKLSKK